MPRVYDSGNSPLDFCQYCYPSEVAAKQLYGDISETGEGPDGRGNCFDYEAVHPPYEDESYLCYECNELLIEEDN